MHMSGPGLTTLLIAYNQAASTRNSIHQLFTEVIKCQADCPNTRLALIGSNQLWRVNDSHYHWEFRQGVHFTYSGLQQSARPHLRASEGVLDVLPGRLLEATVVRLQVRCITTRVVKPILSPRTPDIIAHWQVAPPARPPSRWLPHMILTEPCCSFPDIPNMGWHNKKIF